MGETAFTFLYRPFPQELSCFLVSVQLRYILSETPLSILCAPRDAFFEEPAHNTSHRIGSAENGASGCDVQH